MINRRVQTFIAHEGNRKYENIDEIQLVDEKISIEDQMILKEELHLFETKLIYFNIFFDDLGEEAPRHRKTREQAVQIGKRTSEEIDLVNHLYCRFK